MPLGVIYTQPYRPGGILSALNVSAAAAIKTAPGVLFRIVIVAAGSAGTITVNDCTSTGAAAAGNVLWSATYNATNVYAGAIIQLEAPAINGITLSSISTSGVVAIYYA